MDQLTHIDESGAARMVDISSKQESHRVASAQATIIMAPSTLDMIYAHNVPKGDVFAVARIAAIQAAKRTSELIPLCHPLPISKVDLNFHRESETTLKITSECGVTSRTGVEMEALTAVAVGALTIYDMVKSVERGVVIDQVCLIAKRGGKSEDWTR